MAHERSEPPGPDLTIGVRLSDFRDGKFIGHVGGDEVLLVDTGGDVFAVGARCTHYHAPLVDGVIVGDTVRCPWHHACFDLRGGEAVRAPALAALQCWTVERRGDVIVVTGKRDGTSARPAPTASMPGAPRRIVIVGGGAAGFAATEMLRRRGFDGAIIMLSDDTAPPVDRPNLSKDYLAGTAPEDWLPLWPDDAYRANDVDLRLNTRVIAVDTRARTVTLASGESLAYDRLLLATGAEPVRLAVPGADAANVHTLRSLADCRAIIRAAAQARRALVVGASFIGLEVAAALRTRGVAVDVVAPEGRPMERLLGPALGDFVRHLHEEHGVVFHLGNTLAAIDGRTARLTDGQSIEVDLVVVGIGVRPRTALAEQAGIAVDRGVLVDNRLETNAPGIYAAGDIARWPDPRSRETIRVEHWVVAQRQGQTAACNMLGANVPFDAVPFFWSQHYDVPINYCGHAAQWDEIAIDGDVAAKDCVVRYKKDGRVLAAASIFRDRDNLEIELAMERTSGR